MHIEAGSDVGQPVWHAGAAGDAADDAFGLLQHLGDDPFGAAHLPQDVGVDAPLAAGQLIGPASLGERPIDGVGDQLLVSGGTGPAVIDLLDPATDESKLSAFTALNVPTPPAAAQLPDENPLEMETPLPPSISGNTSIPPMRIALIGFMAVRSAWRDRRDARPRTASRLPVPVPPR